ncbi:NADH:ubiquinone oxidoreductase [Savitreella phatthalungensis]
MLTRRTAQSLLRQSPRARLASTSPATGLGGNVSPIPGPAGTPPPPPHPSPPSPSGGRRRGGGFFRTVWRFTYFSLIAGAGAASYMIWAQRHPGQQALPDPSKKTLVLLGSGWGSCSMLKKLDTENYNVIVISPRNYFLFTPLLPSTTTGTIDSRSIQEPIRHMTRHKRAAVTTYEAEATSIDTENKTITIADSIDLPGKPAETTISYDYLVIGVGAENQTFGIKGVRENACFLKEAWDAQKIRAKIMDCIETAQFKSQTDEERDRLLHMVVVGGGPTGIEFAAELRDFFTEDLSEWYPEIRDKFRVTLVEALPTVLPMFSKQLIQYTESNFKKQAITIHTKTMVKEVTDRDITAEVTGADGSKKTEKIPYGLLVWATGNTPRKLIKDMLARIPEQKDARRGLKVNDFLVVEGTENVWALGDCTATKYAPTAQAASQQGSYLASLFNDMAKSEKLDKEINYILDQLKKSSDLAAPEREALKKALDLKSRSLNAIKARTFEYSHQGSLAYVGRGDAIADVSIPFLPTGTISSGGAATYIFWKAAYLSQTFSLRNRMLIAFDYIKTSLVGRDSSSR